MQSYNMFKINKNDEFKAQMGGIIRKYLFVYYWLSTLLN